jgi:hypothetical protein
MIVSVTSQAVRPEGQTFMVKAMSICTSIRNFSNATD